MRLISKATILAAVASGLLATTPVHAQQTKVAIGYASATDFLAMFVAKEKGFFAKRNIDAEPTRIPIATNIPAALMSNSLQIGMTTGPILLQAAEGGLDLVLVAGATRMLKDNPTISLMARNEVKISSAADLKGKKVGVAGINSVTDVFFKKWLTMNGVKPAEVTIVEAVIPQMPDLLKAGTIDAATAPEPIRSRIVSAGIGYNAADYFTAVNPDAFLAGWIATRDWATKNPAVIKAFREAIDEGLAFVKANEDEARGIEKKYLNVNSPKFPTFANTVRASDLKVFMDLGKELGIYRKDLDLARLVLN